MKGTNVERITAEKMTTAGRIGAVNRGTITSGMIAWIISRAQRETGMMRAEEDRLSRRIIPRKEVERVVAT